VQEAFNLLFQTCETNDMGRLSQLGLAELEINKGHNSLACSTPYSQIFGAIQNTMVRCKFCKSTSSNYDPFHSIRYH
jgi:hypothetical protein